MRPFNSGKMLNMRMGGGGWSRDHGEGLHTLSNILTAREWVGVESGLLYQDWLRRRELDVEGDSSDTSSQNSEEGDCDSACELPADPLLTIALASQSENLTSSSLGIVHRDGF